MAQRYVVICPIARCGKLSVKTNREEALKADRQHWQRVHSQQQQDARVPHEGGVR